MSVLTTITANVPDSLGRSRLKSLTSSPILLANGAAVTHPQIRAYFDSDLGPMSVRVNAHEVIT